MTEERENVKKEMFQLCTSQGESALFCSAGIVRLDQTEFLFPLLIMPSVQATLSFNRMERRTKSAGIFGLLDMLHFIAVLVC